MKKRKRVTPRKVQNRVQNKVQKKIPSLRASSWERERPVPDLPASPGYYRPIKKPVTLRLDADVIAWFQRKGPGYQTRINRALRKAMLDERKS